MSEREFPEPDAPPPSTRSSQDATGPIGAPASSDDHATAVRRRVGHELYGRLALLSAVIWTLGTFLLFITFAAGNPNPIPMAMMSMTAPLLPAALPWLLYRRLTDVLTARQLRTEQATEKPSPPMDRQQTGGSPTD